MKFCDAELEVTRRQTLKTLCGNTHTPWTNQIIHAYDQGMQDGARIGSRTWRWIAVAILVAAVLAVTAEAHGQAGTINMAPFRTPQMNSTLFVGQSGYPSVQAAVTAACALAGTQWEVQIPAGATPADTPAAASGCSKVYVSDRRSAPSKTYVWSGSVYAVPPVLDNGVPLGATRGRTLVYARSYWTGLGDFNVAGTAPTITNGALVFTAAPATYTWDTEALTLKTPIASDDQTDAELIFTYGAGSLTSPSLGGMAIAKASASGSFSMTAAYNGLAGSGLSFFNTATGTITGQNGPFTCGFLPAVGDVMRLLFSERGAAYRATVVDVTKEQSCTATTTDYLLATGSTVITSNTAQYRIIGLGSGITVNSFRAASAQPYAPHVLFVGDSKTAGYSAIASELRFSNLLAPTLGPVANISGPGDTTASVLAAAPYIIALHPDVIVLAIGRNDLPGSGAALPSASQTNYSSAVAQFKAAGIAVIHLLPIPETTIADQSSLASFINSTFAADPRIDVTATTYGPAWSNAADLSTDGTHPGIAGHALIAFDILSSGLIAPRANQTAAELQPWPVVTQTSAATIPTSLQAVTSATTSSFAILSGLAPTLALGNYVGTFVGLDLGSYADGAVLAFHNNGGTGSTTNQAFVGLYGEPGLFVDGTGHGDIPSLAVSGVASAATLNVSGTATAGTAHITGAATAASFAATGPITAATYTPPTSTTAPSGSCSGTPPGTLSVTADGHGTYCKVGTLIWTTLY